MSSDTSWGVESCILRVDDRAALHPKYVPELGSLEYPRKGADGKSQSRVLVQWF